MSIINYFDAFCFDLDGTVYVRDEVLPQVPETIAFLKKLNKRVLFISNSPTQSRRSVVEKLKGYGIHVFEHEVVTTAYLAAKFLAENASDSVTLMIGENALKEELLNYQLKLTNMPLEATHVIVGLDRKFTYQKLNNAMQAIRNGAQLIVTNPDPACPVPEGLEADTMSIANAIATAAEVEINTILGKPYYYFAKNMLDLLGTEPKRSLIVGDRLETDIYLGENASIPTCLVLTGASTLLDVEKSNIKPNYILNTIQELLVI